MIQIFLNQKNLTMKKSIILALICTIFVPSIFSQEIPLEQWSKNHPKASEELGGWVKHHPRTAHALFEWDSQHPERSQEFVNWCIVHPKERIIAFTNDHPKWRGMDIFVDEHAQAMEEFMLWCRNHAEAAKALMAHSKGLAWAGDHLYKEARQMQKR
jgi:hypothetical protein